MDEDVTVAARAAAGASRGHTAIDGRAVWVVGEADALPAAIAAGLRTARWDAELAPAGVRSLPDHPRGGSVASLVLVAEPDGAVPDGVLLSGFHPVTVAVGGRANAGALARSIERGVVAAVDAELPFEELIDSIVHVLATPRAERHTAQIATLRRHDQLAARFTQLSGREQDVLGALVLGLSAAEIAAERHLSIATVRTHIRAILRQLGVSSQLAAVAMTHRYCREPRVLAQLRRLHQF